MDSLRLNVPSPDVPEVSTGYTPEIVHRTEEIRSQRKRHFTPTTTNEKSTVLPLPTTTNRVTDCEMSFAVLGDNSSPENSRSHDGVQTGPRNSFNREKTPGEQGVDG